MTAKRNPSKPPAFLGGVEELASAINRWAETEKVFPVSGQASREVSVRNLRYYRSQALLDGPLEGGGYGTKHFLQVAAVRLLQARGLPLSRIRDLLYGRSEAELERVLQEGVDELHRPPAAAPTAAGLPLPGQSCAVHGLPGGCALIAPAGMKLTAGQLERIARILSSTKAPIDS